MTKDKVKISIYEYNEKMLTEIPLDMNGSVKTPAASHSFNVNKERTKLPKTTAQLLHHLLAKLLYLSRRN